MKISTCGQKLRRQFHSDLSRQATLAKMSTQAIDRMPQELMVQICGHLGPRDLRAAYYVSLKFRKAAETHAEGHRWQQYDVTERNKQSFIAYYSGFRLRYLDRVEFRTHFPTFTASHAGCREGVAEQQEKDRVFTEQIQDLFAILKTVDENAGPRNIGRYKLIIYCPTQVPVDRCLHRKHAYWRTHLLEPEKLPDLVSVRAFEIKDENSSAKLDYRILFDLVTRLSNVESVVCHTGKDEWTPSYGDEPATLFPWEYDGPRRDSRHAISQAIMPGKMPRSLKTLTLDYLCRESMKKADRIHHWSRTPDLVSPAVKDPFSTSLQILSYHLREITLRAQIDDTLFWPEDNSTPTWPHLQRVYVMFHMVSPSGAWYFEGPRGEGRETIGYEVNESTYPPHEATEEDEDLDCTFRQNDRSFQTSSMFWFRVAPNDHVLKPLLEAFAKAAINMPELKEAVLWSPLRWDVDGGEDDEREEFDYFESPTSVDLAVDLEYLAWGFAYRSPGKGSMFPRISTKNDHRTRTLWWTVGDWRPGPEVHTLFQRIGQREHREPPKEYWNNDAFMTREQFEQWTPEE